MSEEIYVHTARRELHCKRYRQMGEEIQQGGRSAANVTDQWVKGYSKEGEALQRLQTNG
jgi:hypothetical protein